LELISSMTKSSFINNEVDNLIKCMKFIWSPIQTRLFKPSLHYQLLQFRGEQGPEFWKEVATTLVDDNYDTKTSRDSYPITMFQEGLPYEPYFIAIDNWGQVIIDPNKKIVATYVVGKLKILIQFIGIWMLKRRYCYDWYLTSIAWNRVKSNNNIIGCTATVLVNASCSRCYIFAPSLCYMTWFASCIMNFLLMALSYI